MTEAQQQALTSLFERWFCGNVAAMRAAALLTQAAHVWDDLVDGDKTVSPVEASNAFRIVMVELPTNHFYRANFDAIHPIVASVWLQWAAATTMESAPAPGDREKCYMLRAGLYQLYHTFALLTGGVEWAEKIGPEIYRAYGESLESFDA